MPNREGEPWKGGFGAVEKSAPSSMVSSIAELLYANSIPHGETVTSQLQALAIVQRILTECREGLRNEYPKAVEITKQLQDCLTEATVTLRAAKDIKRAISSFDP